MADSEIAVTNTLQQSEHTTCSRYRDSKITKRSLPQLPGLKIICVVVIKHQGAPRAGAHVFIIYIYIDI